jgi:hypothetical protein
MGLPEIVVVVLLIIIAGFLFRRLMSAFRHR